MNCPKCGNPAFIDGNSECVNCRTQREEASMKTKPNDGGPESNPPAVAQERPTPRAEALEATPLFSGRPRSPECAEALLELRKAERELAEANEKLADWRGAGMKIGVLLVTSGSKSDGIVDGVRELLANSKSQAEEIDRLRTEINSFITNLPGGQSVDPQSVADDLREILVATSPQKP